MSFGIPVRNGLGIGLRASTALSTRGAGGTGPLTVANVFSTTLYTGTSAAQTITNGINVSGSGGMVWLKARSVGNENHYVYDTNRGASKYINTNNANAQTDFSAQGWFLDAFTSTGFTLDAIGDGNSNGVTYTSWTAREAPKFFDVVTYTGNGANRNIAHNLGSVPGMILVKRTDTTGGWQVYHRSLGNTQYMVLNTIAAAVTSVVRWNSTSPTATEFTVGTSGDLNANGGTYVAYLYAHDAGGFGATGTDSIVSCGSYLVVNEAVPTAVTLGWEPQFLMVKKSNTTSDWWMIDNKRGFTAGGADNTLYANLTTAETAITGWAPTATGFTASGATANGGLDTYIYIAIRKAA